jgi:hypothetical protein
MLQKSVRKALLRVRETDREDAILGGQGVRPPLGTAEACHSPVGRSGLYL